MIHLCHCVLLCLVAQSCLTLCNPVRRNPPGSSVHGIFQVRILEQITISYSRGSFPPRDKTQDLLYLLNWQMGSLSLCHLEAHQFSSVQSFSCVRLCNPMDWSTPGFPVHHHFPELGQTHAHQVSDATQPSHPQLSLSSCLQSFPASGSFLMSHLFTSGSQSIGASASASVFPMTIQD